MKMLVLTTALVAVIAAPALAQSSRHHARAQAHPRTLPQSSYGRADVASRHSSNRAYDVYLGGRYVGSDPDRSIRNELLREGNMSD